MMRFLLALMLAGCAPASSSGLLLGDFLAKHTDALTVTVHNTMAANAHSLIDIYPVQIQAKCGQVLQPPGFALPAGETKSMSGDPGCYPFNVIVNDAFAEYICTLTVAAPGAYSVKHGGLATCSIKRQSSDAVTVDYGQILLKPDDTPGGITSRRR